MFIFQHFSARLAKLVGPEKADFELAKFQVHLESIGITLPEFEWGMTQMRNAAMQNANRNSKALFKDPPAPIDMSKKLTSQQQELFASFYKEIAESTLVNDFREYGNLIREKRKHQTEKPQWSEKDVETFVLNCIQGLARLKISISENIIPTDGSDPIVKKGIIDVDKKMTVSYVGTVRDISVEVAEKNQSENPKKLAGIFGKWTGAVTLDEVAFEKFVNKNNLAGVLESAGKLAEKTLEMYLRVSQITAPTLFASKHGGEPTGQKLLQNEFLADNREEQNRSVRKRNKKIIDEESEKGGGSNFA